MKKQLSSYLYTVIFGSLLSGVLAVGAIASEDHTSLNTTYLYETEVEAVRAASEYYNPLSIEDDREFMGTILRHKALGYYVYTVNAGDKHKDSISITVSVPEQYEWVALWHTHGERAHKNRFFSPQDTQLAKQLNMPFYLANGHGELKVFRPDSRLLSPTKLRNMGLGYQIGVAKGEKIKDSEGDAVKVATTLEEWLLHNHKHELTGGGELLVANKSS